MRDDNRLWRQKAACKDNPFYSPDDWFPEKDETETVDETIILGVKTVCNFCPVKSECLEASLDAREEYGIWGGLDAQERFDIWSKDFPGLIHIA